MTPTVSYPNTPAPIALWRRTALLITLFILIAAAGATAHYRAHGQPDLIAHRPNMAIMYLSTAAAEWGLICYVWQGALKPSGITPIAFVGGSWIRLRDIAREAVIAFGVWMLWRKIALVLTLWCGTGQAASISLLIPRGAGESAIWILLSVSAYIAEEFVFRGYLQRQLTAFTGHAWIGAILQSAIFGISHRYQGVQACIAITIYGALFTGLALWRKSLRPGMLAHAWTDIAAGLLRY